MTETSSERSKGDKCFRDTAVIILAKAPIPGFAKTRLIPALGADHSAAVANALLVHALRQALDAGLDGVELCVSPDPNHPSMHSAHEQMNRSNQSTGNVAQGTTTQLRTSRQVSGDLGDRMNAAFDTQFEHDQNVLLMGSDAPELTSGVLRNARAALEQAPAVLVPAVDGGYALIGLTRRAPFLFTNMAWSTPNVLQVTRERLREQRWSWVELDPVTDIDEPADLIHLPLALWPAGFDKLRLQESRT